MELLECWLRWGYIDISSDGGALNEGWNRRYNGGALLSYGTIMQILL